MEIDEVIATLTDLKAYGGFGPYCTDEIEALDMAISALRAQREAETNEPLTPKELDQLERYPVFVVPLDEKDAVPGWCIYQRGIAYTDSLLPPLSYLFYRRDYGVRWVAYHRPPKEAHDAPNPR